MSYFDIPEELRSIPNWCLSGKKGAPLYVDEEGRITAARVNDPSTFMTFEKALKYAENKKLSIGFVLTKDNPYIAIDLDVIDEASQLRKGQPIDKTKWSTKSDFNRFWKIVKAFDSYTEKSRHGKGLHIWLKSDTVFKGRKRDGVEIYSHSHFIICTGEIVNNERIKSNEQLLNTLIEEISSAPIEVELHEFEEEQTDQEIWQIAKTAENKEKFIALCEGRWQELKYPSQSEADLALMSMFAFYSISNLQCRRMFRQTALGKRDKANVNNEYLNATLKRIRARQKTEQLELESVIKSGKEIAAKFAKEDVIHDLETKRKIEKSVATLLDSKFAETMMPLPEEAADDNITWPPGPAGQLASWIYDISPRPVKEIAIATALAFIAGVCGYSHAIPQSGLNMYFIVVAKSGTGKEAIHSGMGAILTEIRKTCPEIERFLDFNEFVSANALVKACQNKRSFVNVWGEFGRHIQRMANERDHSSQAHQIRTQLTNLYQKSGPSSYAGGMNYSNSEKSIQSVTGVAFSLIGETTPATYYESLTRQMMEDGFLSRFLVIEYKGERPSLNIDRSIEMPEVLKNRIISLTMKSVVVIDNLDRVHIEFSDEAKQISEGFNILCDNSIMATEDDGIRQMWNRAHLKALRIAGLLATFANDEAPVIGAKELSWAIKLIQLDIENMLEKYMQGDIGSGDDTRTRKMKNIIVDYFKKDKKVHGSKTVKSQGIISRMYIQQECSKVAVFYNHRLGKTLAVDTTITNLIQDGYLLEVDNAKFKGFPLHGRNYIVSNHDAW